MQYTLLLRGINVGGNRKVEMKRLRALLESLGYEKVSTYLNSGNAQFESNKKRGDIEKELSQNIKKEFGFDIPLLIKTNAEMKKIAEAIPKNWQNDAEQKSDVAYLFAEIDHKKTIDELPIKQEFLTTKYVPGAIIWNVTRKDYNKSHLSKIASHKLYKSMTVRNVNTSRHLGNV